MKKILKIKDLNHLGQLDINSISKELGDCHWDMIKDKETSINIGTGVYCAFMKIDFHNVIQKYQYNKVVDFNKRIKKIDSYVYESVFNFGDTQINMFSCFVTPLNKRLKKFNTGTNIKNDEFWKIYKKSKEYTKTENPKSYKIYKSIHMNCFDLLYYANYLIYYQMYCEDMNINFNIKTIFYYSNINDSDEILTLSRENNNIIMFSDKKLLSKVELYA